MLWYGLPRNPEMISVMSSALFRNAGRGTLGNRFFADHTSDNLLPILTWYFFSDMKFQAEVGFFLSMIMGTNVILTLTLHHLMIYLIKPKFISRGKSKRKEVVGGEVVFHKTLI